MLLTMFAAGNYTNEIEVAAGFLGFWKNFIDTFDMKGREISITGESYAGNYVSVVKSWWRSLRSFAPPFLSSPAIISLTWGRQVPYIAEAMLNKTGKEFESYYNVTGILIYDPILGDEAVTTNAPVADFVMANKNLYETMKPPPSGSPEGKWSADLSDNALGFHLTMIPSRS
jgi:carboxypeptidase D